MRPEQCIAVVPWVGWLDNHNDREVSRTQDMSLTDAKLHMRLGKLKDTIWVHASSKYSDGVGMVYVNKAPKPNEHDRQTGVNV